LVSKSGEIRVYRIDGGDSIKITSLFEFEDHDFPIHSLIWDCKDMFGHYYNLAVFISFKKFVFYSFIWSSVQMGYFWFR
jgi:WD40 repeat protein